MSRSDNASDTTDKECSLPGHAGAFQTSQMMSLYPNLVRDPLPHHDEVGTADPSTCSPPYRLELNGPGQNINGYSDSPDAANSDHGRSYLNASVTALAKL